jgi:predicted nucleic acid-binding protein
VKSLDTNILYYATNLRCPEHARAAALVRSIRHSPAEWIVADQVLFEYYRLVRNPVVLARPLDAAEAMARLRYFREELGCLHCAYDQTLFGEAASLLAAAEVPASRTFDRVLAVTLRKNGVRTFYTRNARHFEDLGWFDVIDPIVEP